MPRHMDAWTMSGMSDAGSIFNKRRQPIGECVRAGLRGGHMNTDIISQMRQGVRALRTAEPVIPEVYWGGAGVVITVEPIPVNPDAFYPPHKQFVTKHPGEATWLFEKLRDLLEPVIDAVSKHAFYERLAIAGERFPEWHAMRNAILDEAERWIDESIIEYEAEIRDVRIH